MTAKVPMRESGTDRLGMMVAGMLRRKTKITSTTRITASVSSSSTSLIEARIVFGPVGQHADFHGRRQRGLERRQERPHAFDHLDHVGARLALDVEDDRRASC